MTEHNVVMGSRMRLTSARHLPRFLASTVRARRQLRSAQGLVDFRLRADLPALTFWTLSMWDDQASMQAFARSNPHAADAADLRARNAIRTSDFAFWTAEHGSPLPEWGEVELRVTAAVSR